MTFRKILAATMIAAAAFGATDAMASGRHGGRHGGGYQGYYGGHHGHGYGYGYGRVGAFVGGAIVAGALLSPWYYSPSYVVSYPTVVEVSPPMQTVYIEQSQAAMPAVASDAGNWWYFCNDTRAYYPYVKECASPWQRVAPFPAPAAPR